MTLRLEQRTSRTAFCFSQHPWSSAQFSRCALDRHVHAWTGEIECAEAVALCGYSANATAITQSVVGFLCPDCTRIATMLEMAVPAIGACDHCIRTFGDLWRWVRRDRRRTVGVVLRLLAVLIALVISVAGITLAAMVGN